MNIDEILTRGVAQIIDKDNLKKRLESGEKLRIKFGVDPTKPDIHLGHMVNIRILKKLQELGHTIIFLIGDYTTRIGDPSGRNTMRPVLSEEEIKANADTYIEQVGKILDTNKTEIRFNSEWYENMKFNDILKIVAKFTAQQIIERDDFQKRMKDGHDLGLHELLYPVMQAYDSVILKADVAFGADQTFNELAGRDLQKKMDMPPQDIVVTKILVGTDGKIKMSKSVGNYIGVTDVPADMFGKVMSIPDEAMPQYFELCTDLDMPTNDNPREIKAQLAREIVKIYHGQEASNEAAAEFDRVYKNKEMPTDIPTINIEVDKMNIIDLIMETKLVESRSEARRLVEQGGLEAGGVKITDPTEEVAIEKDIIIRAGKHKFVKITK